MVAWGQIRKGLLNEIGILDCILSEIVKSLGTKK